MKIKAIIAGLMVLSFGTSAWALTFQDKQDKSISNDGQMRVIQQGTTILHESASDTSLGTAGEAGILTCGTVPADKNWRVTAVGYVYTGTTTNVRPALMANGVTVDQDGAPTTKEAQRFTTDLYLDEDETVTIQFNGYTAADSAKCWVHGYEYPDS